MFISHHDSFLTETSQDDSIDVLEDHRMRNRAMRPPNLDTILADDAAVPAVEDQFENEDDLEPSTQLGL
jgi:hypothetical protein